VTYFKIFPTQGNYYQSWKTCRDFQALTTSASPLLSFARLKSSFNMRLQSIRLTRKCHPLMFLRPTRLSLAICSFTSFGNTSDANVSGIFSALIWRMMTNAIFLPFCGSSITMSNGVLLSIIGKCCQFLYDDWLISLTESC